MPEEYFDVAYINFDKAILHGRIAVGRDEYGVMREHNVEQVLTKEQREEIEEMRCIHDEEMQCLLASFVERPTPEGQA